MSQDLIFKIFASTIAVLGVGSVVAHVCAIRECLRLLKLLRS